MEYLLLIYDVEADMEKMRETDRATMYQDFGAFTQSIQKSGHFRSGKQLQPVATATTVRVKDGKRGVTDGPFAETREQLGGFYLIEARDLDEALGIAERCPGARLGSVEVRPIVPPHA
ncbi:MAG TPA: YciI family protein [Bryobacteraceae bacterium]|nr:YciI family protein [Bryobacteraceae bacterium]